MAACTVHRGERTGVRPLSPFSGHHGIRLEMAAWARAFTEKDRRELPMDAEGR